MFALGSAEDLHSPHVEALVKFKDKTRHLVLSKVPIEIPRDAETVWQEKGQKLAVAAADKYAESKIPPPHALCRNENETFATAVETYQPHVVAYPLYYGHYTYRDRKYRIVVDGFTKEVAGEKPFGLKNRKWAGIFPTF